MLFSQGLIAAVGAVVQKLPPLYQVEPDLHLRIRVQGRLALSENLNGHYRRERSVEFPLRGVLNPIQYLYACVEELGYLPTWDEFYDLYTILTGACLFDLGILPRREQGLRARLYRTALGYYTELQAMLLLAEHLPSGTLWRGVALDAHGVDALWRVGERRIGIRCFVRTERSCAYRAKKDRAHRPTTRCDHLVDLTYSVLPGEPDSLILMRNGLGYFSSATIQRWLEDLIENHLNDLSIRQADQP